MNSFYLSKYSLDFSRILVDLTLFADVFWIILLQSLVSVKLNTKLVTLLLLIHHSASFEVYRDPVFISGGARVCHHRA